MNAVKKLAEEDLSSSKKKEYLDLVKSGLDNVKETVNGLLQFAPRSAVTGAVDLRDAAVGAAALVEHYAEERNVDLANDIKEDYRISADEGKLKQVFVNLLMNAIDAAGDGGKVAIRATEMDGRVAVCFEDGGKGMTQEEVLKAFELFYTTKERGRGSGLGLPIVANIVEKYKGEIRIDSSPGRGNTVTVVFPIVPLEGSES